mmetsp:Transcript_21524/g.41171  ORF Transcript_21524/g.41171 Transcript_21524/m.41171 type:complete len:750 (+) Transcript_21524:464-2713(+)
MRLSIRNSILIGAFCATSTVFGSSSTTASAVVDVIHARDAGTKNIDNEGTAASTTEIKTKTMNFKNPRARELRMKTKNVPTADRIINGEEAIPGRYSYMTFLLIETAPGSEDNEQYSCGGTLIARDVILTAAHCINGVSALAAIGRHNLTDNTQGEVIPVANFLPHPDYSNATSGGNLYDTALFVLPQEITQDVELITLNPVGSVPAPGDPVTAAGWGRTDAGNPSDVLLKADLVAIDNVQCYEELELFFSQYNEFLEGQGLDTIPWTFSSPIEFDSIICATDDVSSTCKGDSGGPLFIPGMDESGADDVQVGIVSWGSPTCNLLGVNGVPPPVAYTRISEVYDWIRSNVCEYSSNPPNSFDCPPGVGDLPGAPDDDGTDVGGNDDDTSSSSKSSKSAKSSDDDDGGDDDDDDDDNDDWGTDDGEYHTNDDLSLYMEAVCNLIHKLKEEPVKSCMKPFCEIGLKGALLEGNGNVDDANEHDDDYVDGVETPTIAPTMLPTVFPSLESTKKLSTNAPTTKPTDVPTSKPTALPTMKPTSQPTIKPTSSPTKVQAGYVEVSFEVGIKLEGIDVSDLDITQLDSVVNVLEQVFKSMLPEDARVRLLKVGGISVSRRILRVLQDSISSSTGVDVEFEVIMTKQCDTAKCTESDHVSDSLYTEVTKDLKTKMESGSVTTAIQEKAKEDGVTQLENISVSVSSLTVSDAKVTVTEGSQNDDTGNDTSDSASIQTGHGAILSIVLGMVSVISFLQM